MIAAADAGQRVRRPLDDLHEHLPRLREAPDDLPVRGVVVDEQQTLARERSLVVRRRGGAAASRATISNWNVEPASLSAESVPPIRSASRFEIARPSPVPP